MCSLLPCRLLDNLDSYSLLRKVLQSSLLFWQSCECAGKCFQQEFSCALHYKKVNFLWNTSCPVGRILRHQVLQIINCRVLFFSPSRIEFSRSKVFLIPIKRFKIKSNSTVLFSILLKHHKLLFCLALCPLISLFKSFEWFKKVSPSKGQIF